MQKVLFTTSRRPPFNLKETQAQKAALATPQKWTQSPKLSYTQLENYKQKSNESGQRTYISSWYISNLQ